MPLRPSAAGAAMQANPALSGAESSKPLKIRVTARPGGILVRRRHSVSQRVSENPSPYLYAHR